MFVICFLRGVSRTPRERSSNPEVDVVALCSCEVKRCCIFVFNVLIASDIILRIITSTFIVPGGTGLSGGGGNSGVDHRVGVMFLLELDPVTSCVCVRRSVAIGMFPGMERGWIGATGL